MTRNEIKAKVIEVLDYESYDYTGLLENEGIDAVSKITSYCWLVVTRECYNNSNVTNDQNIEDLIYSVFEIFTGKEY